MCVNHLPDVKRIINIANFQTEHNALDLACGLRWMTLEAKKTAPGKKDKVTIVEISEKMLENGSADHRHARGMPGEEASPAEDKV